MNYLKISFLFIPFFLLSEALRAQISSTNVLCTDKKFENTIYQLWNEVKDNIKTDLTNSGDNTVHLYNTQLFTEYTLRLAFNRKDFEWVDEHLDIYSNALSELTYTNLYRFYGYPSADIGSYSTQELDSVYPFWVSGSDSSNPNVENILHVSQFLSLVSYTLFEISKIDKSNRTSSMKSFVSRFTPILDSHYGRWVFGVQLAGKTESIGPFQRRGWRCEYEDEYAPTLLTHQNFIKRLKSYQMGDDSDLEYCNAVTDSDLWIISGVSTYLAAYNTDTSLFDRPIHYSQFSNYLVDAFGLVESRMDTVALSDFKSKKVIGALFDKGGFNDFVNHKYAGNEVDSAFPNLDSSFYKDGIGWDLSHARRFISVFLNLNSTKGILGFDFPKEKVLTQLANQYVYSIFNGDFKRPSFSNYFDGTNGWYRVRSNGFGHAPSNMSFAALSGGYSLYGNFNSDVKQVTIALYNLLHSTDTSDRNYVIKRFEHAFWRSFKPVDNYNFNLPFIHDNSDSTLTSKRVILNFYACICNEQGKTKSVKQVDKASIKVYPNPVTDGEFIIDGTNYAKYNRVELKNALGQQVSNLKTIKTDSKIVVFVDELPSGVYYLLLDGLFCQKVLVDNL